MMYKELLQPMWRCPQRDCKYKAWTWTEFIQVSEHGCPDCRRREACRKLDKVST